MILLGAIATALMVFYAGYLFRCEYYFSRLDDESDTIPLQAGKSEEGDNSRDQPRQPQPIASIAGKPLQASNSNPIVSIIIPARNEEQNIAACLKDIFAQEYPHENYEVILVNDHSEDKTRLRAEEIGRGQPNFLLIDLDEKQGVAYKKAAVAKGIEASRGEIILVSDADCRMGPHWLTSILAYFKAEVGMVSGPVLLESETVFGDFQALEFMGLIAVGGGSIAGGSPNMCNGANLAYRKEVFEQVGGFSGIDEIASGDDELLMHKIVDETEWKVAFAKSQEAIVRTAAHKSWRAFRDQRLRWVSKSTHYQQSKITRTLILSYLAILGLPLLFVSSFFAPELWVFFGISLGLKVLAEATILRAAALFFDKLPLLRWLLPEQIAHIGYVLWVGIAGNRKSYIWKGRKVK